MIIWRAGYWLLLPLILLLLPGCTNTYYDTGDSPSTTFTRDSGISNSLGEVYLDLDERYSADTVAVHDSSTDSPVSGVQLLGIAESGRRLFVAADPQGDYHPMIASGESSQYYDGLVYLTPIEGRLGDSGTMYPLVNGGLLDALANEYGSIARSVTVLGLRDALTDLVYNETAALVICANEPLDDRTGTIPVTEIALRSYDLERAMRDRDWYSLYASHGFSGYQQITLWVLHPSSLRIAGNGSGALADTLIVVAVPTSYPDESLAARNLKVELTWDERVDLDLHLVRNGADLYDPLDDCFWKYIEQNWGDPYQVSDNPRLLYDNRSGYGPETIILETMTSSDQYTVAVDYWGSIDGHNSTLPVSATVRVWTNNNSTPRTFRIDGLNYGAPETGQYKVVCNIDGRTGLVTLGDPSLGRVTNRSLGSKPN